MRAVALIDHDEVERLDGNLRVVDDRQRLLDERGFRLEQRAFLVLLQEVLLALEHRVEPLDRRDADLGGRVDGVLLQVLDGVFLGELVAVVRADELLELVERLLAQVVAVHQEQNPLGLGELDEPVAEVDGGEGLAAAGGHLDQRRGGDCRPATLRGSGCSRSARARAGRCSSGGISRSSVANLLVELGQADQFFGPMEGEDLPAAGVGLQGVGELRDGRRWTRRRRAAAGGSSAGRRAGRRGTCPTAFRRR